VILQYNVLQYYYVIVISWIKISRGIGTISYFYYVS